MCTYTVDDDGYDDDDVFGNMIVNITNIINISKDVTCLKHQNVDIMYTCLEL